MGPGRRRMGYRGPGRGAPRRVVRLLDGKSAVRTVPLMPTDDLAPRRPSAHVSRSTRESYTRKFEVFRRFAETQGESPLPASPDLVCRFVGAAALGHLRRPGKGLRRTGEPTPLAPSTLDQILCAVSFRHEEAGHLSPVSSEGVRAARDAYRAQHATVPERATPLPVDDLVLLSWAPRAAGADGLARAAAAVLLLTLGVTAGDLAAVTAGDVAPIGSGGASINIAGVAMTVGCSCSGAAFGHWKVMACQACCVLALAECAVVDDELLFHRVAGSRGDADATAVPASRARVAHRLRTWAARVAAAWPAARYVRGGQLQWAPGFPPDERAASLHGIVLAATGHLQDLQLRMILLTSFTLGLRQDDLARVTMACVRREAEGYLVRIPSSKGDQDGRGAILRMVCAKSCSRCAVCALDEWLWLLRAAGSGPASLLRCRVTGSGLSSLEGLAYPTMWGRLAEAQKRAGLTRRYSTHSLRRGFAAEALRQGADLEAVQATLRHKKLDTTARYIDPTMGRLPEGIAVLAGWESSCSPGASPDDRAGDAKLDTAEAVTAWAGAGAPTAPGREQLMGAGAVPRPRHTHAEQGHCDVPGGGHA